MRTGRTFEVVHIVTKSGAFALPPNYQHHSSSSSATTGWKSPVPYLFGGLAAMLGLIAFALLILACSYWKLAGNFDADDNSGDDVVDGEKVMVAETKSVVYENSILVIMAGEEKPTFLAMPAAGRTTSFGDSLVGPSCSCTCSSSSSNSSHELDERENDKVVTATVISDGGQEKR